MVLAYDKTIYKLSRRNNALERSTSLRNQVESNGFAHQFHLRFPKIRSRRPNPKKTIFRNR